MYCWSCGLYFVSQKEEISNDNFYVKWYLCVFHTMHLPRLWHWLCCLFWWAPADDDVFKLLRHADLCVNITKLPVCQDKAAPMFLHLCELYNQIHFSYCFVLYFSSEDKQCVDIQYGRPIIMRTSLPKRGNCYLAIIIIKWKYQRFM